MESHGLDQRRDCCLLPHVRQRTHWNGPGHLQQHCVRPHGQLFPTETGPTLTWADRGIRTTCQFNSKICYPDSAKEHLWCSDSVTNYGFDETKLSFFADGCAVDLNDDASEYTIKSAVNEGCLVDLRVTRKAPGFQAGKNGTSYYGTDERNPWGSMRHVFWPRCHVEGTMTTKDGPIDFKGRAMFAHALQGMKPHHAGKLRTTEGALWLMMYAAAKWNFINFQTPSYSAVMMEFTTPPSYGSSVVTIGCIAIDDEVLLGGSQAPVAYTEVREDPDWPEPGAVKLNWTGKTKDGKTATAELAGGLGKRLDKIDVMAEVPNFVKTIVGGVVG